MIAARVPEFLSITVTGAVPLSLLQHEYAESILGSLVLAWIAEWMREVTHAVDDARPVTPVLVAVHHQFDADRVPRDHLGEPSVVFAALRMLLEQAVRVRHMVGHHDQVRSLTRGGDVVFKLGRKPECQRRITLIGFGAMPFRIP